MTIRRSSIIAAIVIGASLVIGQIAVSAITTHPVRAGQMQRMARALGLTDNQKAAIRPILQNARAQVQAIRANTTLTPEQRKAEVMQVRKTTREQIAQILTPEQRQKWAQMKRQAIGARLQRVANALGLTEGQRADIKSIMQQGRTQIQSVRKDAQLSTADKQAQIKEIRSITRNKMLAVLTPEQRAKWDVMKQNRAGRK